MADDRRAFAAFAEHYQNNKFTDLRLVAEDGTNFDVHKLVVCSQSCVLDAKVAEGATVINMTHGATAIEEMVDWMYGIDSIGILEGGYTLKKILAECPDAVPDYITCLTNLARIAEEYQLPNLESQSIKVIKQLIGYINDHEDAVETVNKIAPKGVLGKILKELVSQISRYY